MPDTGRVRTKLSGPMRRARGDWPCAALTPMTRAPVKHAPERLVRGTDWPHVNPEGRGMPDHGDLVELIPDWIEGKADRRRILVDDPRALDGFPSVA
jgi:predicted TIM-barrel fold metal-dependent hydrolase